MNEGTGGVLAKGGNIIMGPREIGWKMMYKIHKAHISDLVASLVKNAPAFPEDTTLPFPLSKDSTHLVVRVCSLQVYINEEILGYIISIHLVGSSSFGIYKLIPKPVALDHIEYLYDETEKNILIDRLG
jgi:hypothetical protein